MSINPGGVRPQFGWSVGRTWTLNYYTCTYRGKWEGAVQVQRWEGLDIHRCIGRRGRTGKSNYSPSLSKSPTQHESSAPYAHLSRTKTWLVGHRGQHRLLLNELIIIIIKWNPQQLLSRRRSLNSNRNHTRLVYLNSVHTMTLCYVRIRMWC